MASVTWDVQLLKEVSLLGTWRQIDVCAADISGRQAVLSMMRFLPSLPLLSPRGLRVQSDGMANMTEWRDDVLEY